VPEEVVEAPSGDDEETPDDEEQEEEKVPETPLAPLIDRTGDWTLNRVALLRYTLPSGVTLITEAPMNAISRMLGIPSGHLGKAFSIYGQMTYHPAHGDQPLNTKNVAVWQALALYEIRLIADMPSKVTKGK
jgi:hypothetical protein